MGSSRARRQPDLHSGCGKWLLVSTDYWRQRRPGANLRNFEGSSAGLSPVIAYVHKVGEVNMLAELEWLHEVEAQKRLKGDYLWLK